MQDDGLQIVGVDEKHEARIVELPTHRFYVATLSVPQFSSAPEQPHPLILAYLNAARRLRMSSQGR